MNKAKGGGKGAGKGDAARPLCLDYLNGTCSQLRSYCRYYHPKPHEAAAHLVASMEDKQAVKASTPICEVWALTGFCKFGSKCWKQHINVGETQLEAPVAEPLTKKFQEWLQSRTYQGAGSEGWKGPSQNGSVKAGPQCPPQAPHRNVDHPDTIVPQLLQLIQAGHGPQDLASILHSAALRASVPGSMYARCARIVRDALPLQDQENFDKLSCGLVYATMRNVLSSHAPRTIEEHHVCLRNAAFLGELFLFGIAQPHDLENHLELLLFHFEDGLRHQDIRVQMMSQLLTVLGPHYQVNPAHHQRIYGLAQSCPTPAVAHGLWSLLGALTHPPAAAPCQPLPPPAQQSDGLLPLRCASTAGAPEPAPERFVHQPYQHQPYAFA